MHTDELHQFMLAQVKSKKYKLRNLGVCDVPAGAICYVIYDKGNDDKSLLAVIQQDQMPMVATQHEHLYVKVNLDIQDFSGEDFYIIATDPFIYMYPKLEEPPCVLQAVMDDLEPNQTFERVKTPFLR